MVTGLIKCKHCKIRSAVDGRTKCAHCIRLNEESRLRIRAYREQHGLCMQCGKVPRLPTVKMCADCRVTAHAWSRNAHMRARYGYGFTMEERLKLFDKQSGFCAFCGLQMIRSRFHVDHCHMSGKVRGAVHMKCNIAIGVYENCGGKEFIANIKAYLGDPW